MLVETPCIDKDIKETITCNRFSMKYVMFSLLRNAKKIKEKFYKKMESGKFAGQIQHSFIKY